MCLVIEIEGNENIMAKAFIVEKHSMTLEGILNLEDMSMEFDNKDEKQLYDLFKFYNDKKITLSINLTSEVN